MACFFIMQKENKNEQKNKERNDWVSKESREAYDLLAEEGFNDLLASDYEFLTERFEEETGYTIGSNGRSSGYLVLYDKEHPATSIDSHEDFEGWNRAEVEERYNLVKRFDDYCGYFVDDFKDIVENFTIREEKVITKVKVFDLD